MLQELRKRLNSAAYAVESVFGDLPAVGELDDAQLDELSRRVDDVEAECRRLHASLEEKRPQEVAW